ncbi:MAG: glycosyltransferase family 4 protein [Candidatus Paceibacterota bacterium]|nr:MAG: glycosyltransferase family 4 protein [Candidatus Paceibacterota bacterium]
MKLLYISSQRLPTEKAYGVQIAHMCKAFGQSGISTELLIPTRHPRVGEDIFAYYNVPRVFSVRRVWAPEWVHPFFPEKLLFWGKQVFSGLILAWHAWRSDADLVYTRDELVALCVAIISPRRIVFEAHTFSKRRSFIYWYLRRSGVRLVVINESIRKAFVDHGFFDALILSAPDGVDVSLFQTSLSRHDARSMLDLPIDGRLIMYTGQLFPHKGADTLLETATQMPHTHFVFVGGMPQDVQRAQERYQNFPNIHIIGHRPHHEMPMFLCAADVLVIPNSGRYESSRTLTSPLKVFEYMASRRVIVASDVPALREVLSDESALWFVPDDPNSLMRCLQRALVGEGASEMIERAYTEVQKMTWDQRAKNIALFYSQHIITFLTPDARLVSGWGRLSADIVQGLRDAQYRVGVVTMAGFQEGGALPLFGRRQEMLWGMWRALPLVRASISIHAIDINPLGIVAWVLARMVRRKYVITLVGTYSLGPLQHWPIMYIARLALKGARARIAISSFMQRRIRGIYSSGVIDVIHPAVHIEEFTQRHEEEHPLYILSVGALKERKGYHISIPAFAQARSAAPDARYIIVGDQRDVAYMHRVRALVRELGLDAHVFFENLASSERLKKLYKGAALFVFPSVNSGAHVEGFGIVCVEAAASGLPIIATQGTGAEDAVSEENAILVPQNDIEALADAMQLLLVDEARRRSMGVASVQHARAHDSARSRAAYGGLYRSILS